MGLGMWTWVGLGLCWDRPEIWLPHVNKLASLKASFVGAILGPRTEYVVVDGEGVKQNKAMLANWR
jgi:hypothetical protein